eukprot:g8173.t1
MLTNLPPEVIVAIIEYSVHDVSSHTCMHLLCRDVAAATAASLVHIRASCERRDWAQWLERKPQPRAASWAFDHVNIAAANLLAALRWSRGSAQPAPPLRRLSLTRCFRLHAEIGAALRIVLRHGAALEHLFLGDFERLGSQWAADGGAASDNDGNGAAAAPPGAPHPPLPASLPHLRCLGLTNCTALSPTLLEALLDAAPRLRFLFLGGSDLAGPGGSAGNGGSASDDGSADGPGGARGGSRALECAGRAAAPLTVEVTFWGADAGSWRPTQKNCRALRLVRRRMPHRPLRPFTFMQPGWEKQFAPPGPRAPREEARARCDALQHAVPLALACRNCRRRTPLHLAAQELPASWPALRAMLRAAQGRAGCLMSAAAVEVPACGVLDSKGCSPLHRAVERGCLEAVRWLA